MDSTLRHKLMAYLGGLAISLAGRPVVGARSDLELIPEPMLEEFLDEVETESWRAHDLDSLLRLLAQDGRAPIRRRVAELFLHTAHSYPPAVVETIAMKFAGDRDPVVRIIGARIAAEWLARMTELERIHVVLEWSLAKDPAARLTMLRALAHQTRVLGADLAIDHLANDVSPEVRAAAIEAAEQRFHDHPAQYAAVLKRLSADRTRSVRRAALRAAARVHADA